MNQDSAGQTPASRIDASNDAELRRWADKLDSTPQQIKEAVQAVGDSAPEVEAHLKGVRSSTNSERVQRSGGSERG